MSDKPFITGGCLCGAVRYEARAEPSAMGHCYCGDCRKASGSGFIPFAMFQAKDLTISGPLLTYTSPAKRGVATRNSCARCGGLVFGGPLGETDSHTIYAGSFDDPSRFVPRIAIFTSRAPKWAMIPPGLVQFEEMPG
jgi:hypothetical protein